MQQLEGDLYKLHEKVLVRDCPLEMPCEADVLAGLVFEKTRPSSKPHPRASGVTRARNGTEGRRRVVTAKALAANFSPAISAVPSFVQEAVCQAVSKLFPPEEFQSFQFLMIEDIINIDPFPIYARWYTLVSRPQDLAWDGSLVPLLPRPQVRQLQRTTDGQQVGAISYKAILPPLLPIGLTQGRTMTAIPLTGI